jgi:uncharacterized membrane protein
MLEKVKKTFKTDQIVQLDILTSKLGFVIFSQYKKTQKFRPLLGEYLILLVVNILESNCEYFRIKQLQVPIM